MPKCPLCGKKHTHGVGWPQEDMMEFLGHHVAHCYTDIPPGGYILVETSGEVGHVSAWRMH